jgi:hypothetical protein
MDLVNGNHIMEMGDEGCWRMLWHTLWRILFPPAVFCPKAKRD